MDSLKQVRWYLPSRRSIHTSWRSRLWYWPHLLPKFPPASLGPMVRTPLATAVDWVNVQIPSNHQSKLFWSGSTLQLWHLMMPSSSSSSSASLLLSLFSYIKCCMDRRNTLGPVATFATSKLGASTIQNCWKVLGPGPSGCPNGWFTVPVGASKFMKIPTKTKTGTGPLTLKYRRWEVVTESSPKTQAHGTMNSLIWFEPPPFVYLSIVCVCACLATFRTTVSHPGANLETLAAHPQLWNTHGINGQPWYKTTESLGKSLQGQCNEGRTAACTDLFCIQSLQS